MIGATQRRTEEYRRARSADPGQQRPLAQAVDWTYQFIGVLAPDGTLLDANQSALSFAQTTLDEVVGQRFWNTPWWVKSGSRAWLRCAVAEAASGALVRSEVEHTSPDGQRIFVHFSLTPLRDENGCVHALLAEGRDITDRREIEDELRASRRVAERAEQRAAFLADATQVLTASLDYDDTFERLATLIVPAMATFCIIDVVDERGVIRRLQVAHAQPAMRETAKRLSRYPRHDQRLYLTRDTIMRGQPRLVSHVDDALLVSLAEDAEHLALLRALGPASYVVAPLVARGRILGAIALCRDGSAPPYDNADFTMAVDLAHRAGLALDNARLYEQARRSTKARDDMLGVVSHDLRNPLAAISMCVQALLDPQRRTDAAREQELLHTIRDSADWAHRLIQDLLDVSAIEAGRLTLERHLVDPVVVAAQAAALFEPLAEEQGITLSLDLPERLPRVHADVERLLQVLANLLGNAIKFTPAGGCVGIQGCVAADRVTLSVTDTGPGIPPEDVPFIFDRYWHARRSAKVRGTGLGLAIVKGIVGAHGGRAWVEPNPGGGSRFSFALPVHAGAATCAPLATG